MARFDPTRPEFSPYGFSCTRWTATTMPRCDRHNEIEFNLLEGGRVVHLMGGGRLPSLRDGCPRSGRVSRIKLSTSKA